MFPQAVDIEPDRLGCLDLFEYLAETFPMTDSRSASVGRDGLGEAGES